MDEEFFLSLSPFVCRQAGMYSHSISSLSLSLSFYLFETFMEVHICIFHGLATSTPVMTIDTVFDVKSETKYTRFCFCSELLSAEISSFFLHTTRTQHLINQSIKSSSMDYQQPKRLSLFPRPTPIESLDRLMQEFPPEKRPTLLLKRDDFTGDPVMSGNKLRKAEYLLQEAIDNGCNWM
jgi:hypothetical protein